MDAALRPYVTALVVVGGVIVVVAGAAHLGLIEISSSPSLPPAPTPAPPPSRSPVSPRRSRGSTKRSSEARVRAMVRKAERTGQKLTAAVVAKRLGVSHSHADRLLSEVRKLPLSDEAGGA